MIRDPTAPMTPPTIVPGCAWEPRRKDGEADGVEARLVDAEGVEDGVLLGDDDERGWFETATVETCAVDVISASV